MNRAICYCWLQSDLSTNGISASGTFRKALKAGQRFTLSEMAKRLLIICLNLIVLLAITGSSQAAEYNQNISSGIPALSYYHAQL